MDTEELRDTMTRNGDALSYPYWATRQILWNGQPVVVREPAGLQVGELYPDEE